MNKKTNQQIIDKLNNLNYDWTCIDPESSWKKDMRCIKLKHKISKEIVICSYQSAKRNNVRFPKYENIQIKKELNNLKHDWTCIDPESSWKKGSRYVKLKHKISKEIVERNYSVAKINAVRFPIYENMMIIKELNNLNYDWTCIDPESSWKKESRYVKLKHKISKEIIICRYKSAKKNNIHFPKYENILIMKKLNKLNYGWTCIHPGIAQKGRLVKLKHKVSKEIIICRYQSAKKNAVRFPNYENMMREKKINELGKKVKPQYICVSSNCERNKNGEALVKIKRKDGKGQIKKVQMTSLLQGCNPFNETQNRVEVNKIQPMYEKRFRKNKIPFIKEYRLGKKRIDYLLFPKTLRIGTEVKQSEKKHHYTKNQISNYKKIGSLKQYNISEILLSDPKGIHKNSLSINQLISLLKKKSQNDIINKN